MLYALCCVLKWPPLLSVHVDRKAHLDNSVARDRFGTDYLHQLRT